MAKKVRRRSAPTSSTQKPKKRGTRKKAVSTPEVETKEVIIPTIEEREETAGKIKEVVPKVYQHRTGIDRLNSLRDYTEELKPNRLETLIAKFYTSTEAQLKAIAEDPHATILEKTLLQMFQESMDKKNKSKNAISQYLHSRISGMPKKEVVFSGHVNQNLQYETKQVPDIDNMSREQRDEFMKMLDKASELPLKEIQVDQSDE